MRVYNFPYKVVLISRSRYDSVQCMFGRRHVEEGCASNLPIQSVGLSGKGIGTECDIRCGVIFNDIYEYPGQALFAILQFVHLLPLLQLGKSNNSVHANVRLFVTNPL